MNQMNMAGFNAGNVALGHNSMPMPNNGPNGVARMPEDHVEDTSYESKLNGFIYGYLCKKKLYEAARELKNSGLPFDPSLDDNDANGVDNNMHTDSKDNIDKDRPGDLPEFKGGDDGQGGSFLLSWFALFWDIYFAQRKNSRASNNAIQYVQHTQQQARLRQQEQQRLFQGQMIPPTNIEMQNMMRYQNSVQQENLRRNVLQNSRAGGIQPTAQQIQQMRMAAQMGGQQGMPRRDPSEMDMNGQRPRTPSASDHAPSPSKRQRMDGVPFSGPQMMPNGQGLQRGMPPGVIGGDAAQNANHLLMNNGLNPGNLSDSQFAFFQQQEPAAQRKSVEVYAQNLAKSQRQQSLSKVGGMLDQGSPVMDSGIGDIGGPDFYGAPNPAMQMRGGAPQNVTNGQAGGNQALQDYQMQLMLLEQQNKKRLLMARQEQDTIGGRPDGQGGMQGYVPGMSPGSRGGPSPGPGDRKGGTPKMNQVGLPGGGSPMPDVSMRGSPASLNFNQMGPEMYQPQMNGNMRPPPSSNPGFPAQQYTPQQLEHFARQPNGRGMPNGWQQGPQGQAQMAGQPPPQQPAPMGTPQTRNNEMPPPQGVPGATANGRPASPAPAPPTPQTANKANPKGKKDARDRKKPTKKGSMASVAATTASEAESVNAPTPTPATPSTPQHASSFAGPKSEGQPQANMIPGIANGGPEQIPPAQPEANAMQFGLEGGDEPYSMPFNNDITNPDLLENFDFEQFLQSTDGGDFSFDASAFENGDPMEAGMTGT